MLKKTQAIAADIPLVWPVCGAAKSISHPLYIRGPRCLTAVARRAGSRARAAPGELSVAAGGAADADVGLSLLRIGACAIPRTRGSAD